jgi:hypothetical protein
MPNGLVMAGDPDIPTTWEVLFANALTLIGEIARHGRPDPFWTFGGGTVLMLRYGHRFSKDIDIFVPDPQSLGFVTPRLSEVAESITTEYVEAAGYVKLYLAEREPDALMAAGEWMIRHAGAVFQQLDRRYAPLKKQFEAVDVLNVHPTFDQACLTLRRTLNAMLQAQAWHHDKVSSVGTTEESSSTTRSGL